MSAFVSSVNLAEIGQLVGDPARAAMLQALMSGRALTAGELAFQAGVTASTASGHLAKMTAAGLLAPAKQGRHRYFRLASGEVARMLEAVQLVAALHAPPRHRSRSGGDEALRLARTCYDHLAGRLGVALADSLTERGQIELGEEGGIVTAAGEGFLADLGLDLAAARAKRRSFCRPCLDWSERRMHLAGRLGALICHHCLESGWLLRGQGTRALTFSPRGEMVLRDWMGPARWQEVCAGG